MDIAIQKQFYNNCELRPSKPIAPGNAFYFPFDERGLRGPDCIQRLAYSVNQSNQHTCQLFTGLLGSGKSTELQRLRGMLQQRSNRVVLADVELEGWCDYSQPLHFGDILWAVCFALHHQLASDHALKEWFSGITDRFIKILQTEISLEKVDVGLKAGGVDLGGLEFKLKSEPDFRR